MTWARTQPNPMRKVPKWGGPGVPETPRDCAQYVARHMFAWPGGYTLAAVMSDGELLCPDCVRANYREISHECREAGTSVPYVGSAGYSGWLVAGITYSGEWESCDDAAMICEACTYACDEHPHDARCPQRCVHCERHLCTWNPEWHEVSHDTSGWLLGAGIRRDAPPEDYIGIAYDVAIIWEGALGESWHVADLDQALRQADCIAEHLPSGSPEDAPDLPRAEVWVSEVYISDDAIEVTGSACGAMYRGRLGRAR